MLIYVTIGVVLALTTVFRMIKDGKLTYEEIKEPRRLFVYIIDYLFVILTWPIFIIMGIIKAIKLKY